MTSPASGHTVSSRGIASPGVQSCNHMIWGCCPSLAPLPPQPPETLVICLAAHTSLHWAVLRLRAPHSAPPISVLLSIWKSAPSLYLVSSSSSFKFQLRSLCLQEVFHDFSFSRWFDFLLSDHQRLCENRPSKVSVEGTQTIGRAEGQGSLVQTQPGHQP